MHRSSKLCGRDPRWHGASFSIRSLPGGDVSSGLRFLVRPVASDEVGGLHCVSLVGWSVRGNGVSGLYAETSRGKVRANHSNHRVVRIIHVDISLKGMGARVLHTGALAYGHWIVFLSVGPNCWDILAAPNI
jgi:hypothetical protein